MKRKWTFPVKEVISNYDGDTISVVLDLGFKTYAEHSVRLHAVDTPERRGGNDSTRALAELARKMVADWLEPGDVMFQCKSFEGKYGRPTGDFYRGDVSLSNYLIEHSLGVPYAGGSRKPLYALHKANAKAWEL